MKCRSRRWRRCLQRAAFFMLFICLTSFHIPIDRLALHIGKPYAALVKDSTFPVERKTAIYPSEPPEVDSTWISSPVVVKFDDPQHDFTLPPTKFGAVGYDKGKVSTLTTSPMLEILSFDQLIPLLIHLQEMLKSSGWIPRDNERHAWLSFNDAIERSDFQNLLFDQVVVVMLLVPQKYSLALNVKCYARCDERNPKTAKYLIDVSVGADHFSA